ncbi:OB-fold domain-containing protein [Halobacteria archaeon AArc-curdl1]|uniref:OB-fold domain-containing protein n=1 Tax=Natronosalvus hydrolyticus TaxID=2979988 RepID=A0AAP2Z9D6_9EURY|nr:OB-fold domain-containing protein [Halobacteria archaeon AArc-curdl1]
MSDESATTAYDDFLEGLAEGESYFLECPPGHASLPPRYACPDCGATDLEERPLPESGTVTASTVIRVPAPAFAGEAPYVLAIAEFGSIRLTGKLLEVDPDEENIEPGTPISVTTERVGEENIIAFRLR